MKLVATALLTATAIGAFAQAQPGDKLHADILVPFKGAGVSFVAVQPISSIPHFLSTKYTVTWSAYGGASVTGSVKPTAGFTLTGSFKLGDNLFADLGPSIGYLDGRVGGVGLVASLRLTVK